MMELGRNLAFASFAEGGVAGLHNPQVFEPAPPPAPCPVPYLPHGDQFLPFPFPLWRRLPFCGG